MQVATRNSGDRHKSGWLKAVILVIAWLIIISLARDVWRIRTGFNRITESKTRLEVEESRNSNLKEKLSLVMTESYREKLIREKLNMQKIGEVLVVMPKNGGLGVAQQSQTEESLPSWQKWWNLIR